MGKINSSPDASRPQPLPTQHNLVANRSTLQRFPMLIGISGKRFFSTESAKADSEISAALVHRFRTLFKNLDQAFPRTPKVLLTGAAFGADLIAAETALERGDDWAVVAVLPFGRVLFEEDFDPPQEESDPAWRDRYAEHARTFNQVVGSTDTPSSRVLVRELPKLAVHSGEPVSFDRLTRRRPAYDKTLRDNHYEQVGQFIAELSTILIAVMSGDQGAETSEANGSTARIVAYRRAGRCDAVGTDVACRSQILRNGWSDVLLPPAGFVWLMDPKERDDTGEYPIKVLPPLIDRPVDRIYAGLPGHDMSMEPEAHAGPLRWIVNWFDARIARSGGGSPIPKGSLVLASAFDRYHRELGSGTSIDLASHALPTDELDSAGSAISARQGKINAQVKRLINLMAAMFLAAVLFFEIFGDLFNENWVPLGIYLFFLAAIGGCVWYTRYRVLESVAEDYRAVAEILRVQRAWWSAGLRFRADREHLQGVHHDLAPIRDCAKTIIGWIELLHDWKNSAVDWPNVRGTATRPREFSRDEKPPRDWIGSQLWYFTTQTEKRERWVHLTEAGSWCLFVASGWLALILWIWIAFPQVMTFCERIAYIRVLPWVGVPFWLLLALLVLLFRILNHDIRNDFAAGLLTLAAGAMVALAIALAIIDAGPFIAKWSGVVENMDALEPRYVTVKHVATVFVVVLSAVAGAWRYSTERHNIEAEALEYRDARARFERAERYLAEGADPVTGAPADIEKARALVYELSSLSLTENEAWLKSRRQRPLTPIVG